MPFPWSLVVNLILANINPIHTARYHQNSSYCLVSAVQMICGKCSHVFLSFCGQYLPVKTEHYSTYTQLEQSAKAGCELCNLFQAVLLEDYVYVSGGDTTDGARMYLQAYDSAERWEDYFKLDVSGSCSSISSDSNDEWKATSFFVQPILCDIEPTYAKQNGHGSRGLHAIRYERRGLDDYKLVDDLNPYLDMASIPGTLTYYLRIFEIV